MDLQVVLAQINQQAKNVAPLNAKIKFIVDGMSLIIDGTGSQNEVSMGEGDADCTITTSLETLTQLKEGKLNPMMAMMGGKIKITGNMGIAMKLQSLLK